MSQGVAFILVCAGFLGFVAILVWIGGRYSVRAHENMRRLAGALGIDFVDAPPKFGLF